MISRSFDPGALAGAVIAVAISSLGTKGPFEPFNLIISITLLALVLAYELGARRTPSQRVAFAMVCGVCAIPGVGYVLEMFHQFISKTLTARNLESQVSPLEAVIGWVIVAAIVFFILFSRKCAV